MGKVDTIKDFISNVADDAKVALDEFLDRPTRKGDEPATVPQPVRSPDRALSGALGAAGELSTLPVSLAALPDQIAKLSELISKLLSTLESATAVAEATGKVTGRKS